ncbi:MAG: ATP-binding protein [Clostridia bacterium]|nr:ATP-binding protein [Clostridia bacterium]
MVKLIVGLKGTGKTKTLIAKVNEAINVSNGSVVCLEKGDKLRFDIKYQARLIDVVEYDITDAHGLQGFVAGLHASNSDITHIFIDSALKIVGNDVDAFAGFVDVVNTWAEKWNCEVLMTSSIKEEDLPESLKKYL